MKINLMNGKKHYMISLPIILFVLILYYGFSNNSKPEKGYMSIHEAYSYFIKVGAYPEPLDLSIQQILVDNEDIRLSEFLDISTEINKYCLKNDFSWFENAIKQFPWRAMSVMNPSTLHFLGSVEALLVNQVDFANTCNSSSKQEK